MLGGPPPDLPPLTDAHLAAFWRRFDDTAPLHLRAGFTLATALLSLPPGTRATVLERADRLPGPDRLVELVRVVASFAYFSDPETDAAFRQAAP